MTDSVLFLYASAVATSACRYAASMISSGSCCHICKKLLCASNFGLPKHLRSHKPHQQQRPSSNQRVTSGQDGEPICLTPEIDGSYQYVPKPSGSGSRWNLAAATDAFHPLIHLSNYPSIPAIYSGGNVIGGADGMGGSRRSVASAVSMITEFRRRAMPCSPTVILLNTRQSPKTKWHKTRK